MNASDVLRYGHRDVLRSVEGMPDDLWSVPGACGTWSIREVLAHLTSYEQVLVDVLVSLQGAGGPTPSLDRLLAGGTFNDDEVAARRDAVPADVLDEYTVAYERTMELIARLSPERIREPGTLPWYGMEYALDDLICYMSYGHKREHTAQIAAQRDRLG